ncbi:pentapeptide repeat-containing protein [Streptomyces coeruleoprunus]|uniref:Pentapeptide repeat-containing protein n=1 Tax=Streptomyces coeruleoprunus TaxID=285563 RepID=A0ABV9X7V5_9ACTN
MDEITFGRVSLTLPGLDEPGLYLSNVESLENGRGIVQDFQYTGADLRALDLADVQLLTGRIADLRAAQFRLSEVRVNSVVFDTADLGNARWSDSKLSRVVFRNCRVMGATLAGLTLEDVLFDNCRLDYCTFEKNRAVGPVVFSKCSLTEASFFDCDLSGAVFDDCVLRRTEFGKGRYQGTDLRGNDLSAVFGVASLSKVIVDRVQQADMAHALLSELEVTFGDVLDGDR